MSLRLLLAPVKSGSYRRAQFVGDLSGGLIAALVALPYGLAMASLMGLPPVLGIFASIISAPFIALLGRNPVLIGGTSSVTVPFIAQAISAHGPAGGALLMILASLIMVILSLAHTGRHILRVPHAVVSGFTCGIGCLMLASQMHSLLGIAPPADASFASPAQTILSVAHHISDARLAPLIMGLGVMAIAVISSKVSAYIPGPLIGVLIAVGTVQLFSLHEKEVGTLPSGLPPLFAVPFSPALILQLLPSAITLAFVASVNILITSRVVDHFRGHHDRMQPADADAELRAFGIGNAVAGFFGIPPSVGMPARSIAVVKCGGTTHFANLFHAAALILILALGSSLVAHIPIPALAGITAWLALGLLHWGTWRRLPKMRRTDAAAFVLTALAVLFVNSVLAVALGCALYLFPYIQRRFVTPKATLASPLSEVRQDQDEEDALVDSAAD